MVLLRRFQSFALGVVGTLATIGFLYALAAHTSLRFIPPLSVNGTFIGNWTKTTGKYVPDRIWWTSETHLEPEFAYAQYATNEQYFCNAVSR